MGPKFASPFDDGLHLPRLQGHNLPYRVHSVVAAAAHPAVWGRRKHFFPAHGYERTQASEVVDHCRQ